MMYAIYLANNCDTKGHWNFWKKYGKSKATKETTTLRDPFAVKVRTRTRTYVHVLTICQRPLRCMYSMYSHAHHGTKFSWGKFSWSEVKSQNIVPWKFGNILWYLMSYLYRYAHSLCWKEELLLLHVSFIQWGVKKWYTMTKKLKS